MGTRFGGYYMSKKMIPPPVMKAILTGDETALSRFGRAGAMAMRKKQEQKKAKQQALLLRRLEDVKEMMRQANEDVCPID